MSMVVDMYLDLRKNLKKVLSTLMVALVWTLLRIQKKKG